MGVLLLLMTVAPLSLGASTHLVDECPASITEVESNVVLVDFGRAAFGNIRLIPPAGATGSVTVHFGEAMRDGRIDRRPPGAVRYNKAVVQLNGRPVVAAPPPDKRNTAQDSPRHPPAILTPVEWGVVLPFRWVEVEGWVGELLPEQIVRRTAYASTWDDDAASFEASDDMLDKIWALCRHTIQATTFAGIYVDGDRERIPYEADAYLNQLSHYGTDNDIQMARDTFDHLMVNGTWPTEWAPHMVFMAHADWMHTGDVEWLKPRYEALKSKTLMDRRGSDGLVRSTDAQVKKNDIIDWPPNERDGYVRTPVNTVVNAFHIRSLEMMAEMARAIGNTSDAAGFDAKAEVSRARFQEAFFDGCKGLYRDGVDTDHVSLHANLFPLAFGLAPEKARATMAKWLADRGMKCSVYAAQYLLEGLFINGADRQAVALMTAPNDRSWRHMIESGTTITWEAWDQKYKPNQDWNHAWGAAPANLLPRFVLGVQPLIAGWETARIRPCVAGLRLARGKVPTPRGPVHVAWENEGVFSLWLKLPDAMNAMVDLPVAGSAEGVFHDGKAVKVTRVDDRWILDDPVSGTITLVAR